MTLGATGESLQTSELQKHIFRHSLCTEAKAKPEACWVGAQKLKSSDLNRTFISPVSTLYCSRDNHLNKLSVSLQHPQVEYEYKTSFKTREMKELYFNCCMPVKSH